MDESAVLFKLIIVLVLSCLYVTNGLATLLPINYASTYFLSERSTFTERKAILFHTESSLARRYRFLLTRDNTDRLLVSQKRKMASRTSSGKSFKFVAHSVSFWDKGMRWYQRRTTEKQSFLHQRLRWNSHAKEIRFFRWFWIQHDREEVKLKQTQH